MPRKKTRINEKAEREREREKERGILRVSSFSATYYEYGKNVSTTIYTLPPGHAFSFISTKKSIG